MIRQPVNHTIKVHEIMDEQGFEQSAGMWSEFCDRDDVSSSVWCRPEAIRGTLRYDKANRLILADAYEQDRRVAVLPFRAVAGRVSFSLGVAAIGSAKARSDRLYDYEFPAVLGENRCLLFIEAICKIRESAPCDVAIMPNFVLDKTSLVNDARLRHMHPRIRNRQATYLIEMPAGHEEYMSGLSTGTRQSLQRKTRKMSRECGGEVHMRCFRQAADMAELHSMLCAVWQESWQGKMGRYRPPTAQFLEGLARHGWVRSYVLLVDGNPVASVFGLQYKGVFWHETPTHSAHWNRFSPGTVLNNLLIEDLFRADVPRIVDFGFGYNQYKETLGNVRQMRGELWCAVTLRGRSILAGTVFCDSVSTLARRILSKLGLLRKLKARARAVPEQNAVRSETGKT